MLCPPIASTDGSKPDNRPDPAQDVDSDTSDCGFEAYKSILKISNASSINTAPATKASSLGDTSPSQPPSEPEDTKTGVDLSPEDLASLSVGVSTSPKDRIQSTSYILRRSKIKRENLCTQKLGCVGSRTSEATEDSESHHEWDGSSLDVDWLGSDSEDECRASHDTRMRQWQKIASGKFEKILLDCIVNTDSIKDNYGDIFTSSETITRLERVTQLSLRRQRAFSFGVLANHRVTGAILYGPPGTGKTLMAKALAKASGFNMMCISTAEVWQKCHGDDERMVKAVFRLARKMYPCIVFIDEADAMLGQRKQGEKRHLKSMINQFLIEWEGLSTDKKAPFVLLATNRPTDLDPAVIRRAPEHIYMGNPNLEERAGIIEILLKGEVLGRNVSPHWLAQRTPGYTGSDLKNVCVTAATICVGQQREDRRDRVLEQSHFSAALRGISASKTKRIDAEMYERFS